LLPPSCGRHLQCCGASRPLGAVGLGAWLHDEAPTIADQIVADPELGADGFVLFSFTPWLGTEVLPRLRGGVFEKR
jgi:hypothetical protein